jgi:hypothetical protein
MGYEMALLSLQSEDPFVIYPSRFVRGEEKIRINGLVWMGELSFMKTQIDKIIDQGFDCIKLKIGNWILIKNCLCSVGLENIMILNK